MTTPPPQGQDIPIAEQLRTLAADLERHGAPDFVEALMARGRSEGHKGLADTADHFLRRVDAARDTLRAMKHDGVAPYRAAILKILKAIETAADVKFARRGGGAPQDDGEWMLAQRLVLLPEHYRTLSADHGKTLNDLASEVATAITAKPAGAPRPRAVPKATAASKPQPVPKQQSASKPPVASKRPAPSKAPATSKRPAASKAPATSKRPAVSKAQATSKRLAASKNSPRTRRGK